MNNNGWMPIESAPEVSGDYFWALIAFGPSGDKTVSKAFRYKDKWYAASTFYCANKYPDRSFEMREHTANPTHWHPLPAPPTGEDA